MAEIELTVKQITNLGLWDKVCEYKGWDEWIIKEGKINEDELVTFDDEFKKENKWTVEYTNYINEIVEVASEAYELAKNNMDLQEKINSLSSYAVNGVKYEVIVREIEEYLEENVINENLNDIQEVLSRGLNIDLPEEY